MGFPVALGLHALWLIYFFSLLFNFKIVGFHSQREGRQVLSVMDSDYSDHESTQTQYGSNSEDEPHGTGTVAIICHSLDGENIGVCYVSRDATVGQLISQLKIILPNPNKLWFENRKFAIGNQEYGFDNAYSQFM